jgi:hypothetical protein
MNISGDFGNGKFYIYFMTEELKEIEEILVKRQITCQMQTRDRRRWKKVV